jgi:tetratricopeptide (TPR) repeat protein
MAILQTDDANLIESETINWRLIVYPILAVLVIGVCGLGYYYYKLNQREDNETNARALLVKATTPEEFLKVADQYPGTDQATIAIMSAASAFFDKHDYDGALSAYNKILADTSLGAQWYDSATLGTASVYEATGKVDQALAAYLEVAHQGDKSAYAPYAYNSAARVYDGRGDKENERLILGEAAALDPDSTFTKQAQYKLKELNTAAAPPMTVNVPATPAAAPAPISSAPAAPAPAPPSK